MNGREGWISETLFFKEKSNKIEIKVNTSFSNFSKILNISSSSGVNTHNVNKIFSNLLITVHKIRSLSDRQEV